jgi:hypothetical protein
MAKTISNLLVGIGFDLDDKSTDKVSSGIDSIKSKALKLGSVVAGAFGIKALTSDFANAKDDLGKFSEVFGSTAENINAFGNALRLEGGTLGGFMSQLANLEKFRAGLAVGDAGFIAAAGRAGLDTQALIEAKNATEGYLTLADQFQRMTRKQRINAADALGLDEASIRLLSKGRAGIEDVVEQQRKMRPVTNEMTKAAAEFNDEFQDLTTNIGGFADKISAKVLPQINNVISGMNDWIAANRELLNSGTDTFLDSISENIVGIAASLGLISAGTGLGLAGKVTSTVGGKLGSGGISKAGGLASKAGGLASRAGAAGLALTAGLAIGDIISKNLSDDVNRIIGGTIAQALENLGFGEDKRATQQRPIVIHSSLTMDGKVIDRKVQTVVGGMADQAIQDLSSTEGG